MSKVAQPSETTSNNIYPPWVERQLKDLIHKPGHALLLSGPSGLNQFDLALALARAWLCDSPRHDGLACGQCESCHIAAVHTHPDLKVLLPQDLAIELGWSVEEQGGTQTEDKKRKPSKEIRAEALREMVEFTQRTHTRSQGQVVLIYPTERMNIVSANTVLKTLEEPTGKMRFILATENAQRLLPTIRSRCQAHVMVWPTEDEAMAWLQQFGAADPQVMLAAAGGRPAQALYMIEQGMNAQKWVQIPRALSTGNVAAFDGMLPAQMLDIASKLCHDLLAIHAGAAPRFYPLKALPRRVNEKAVLDWSKEVMQAQRVAEHPWNVPLYTQALVCAAQKALSLH